ncbi:hypothetical protein ACELLULO517_26570 [Acidisoma cellulosilytica]|uniref:Uncharacterized protein n=1 Tax=Acidisoma cellulosilyticum TaxID=2802395 RepID=A0A963Z7B5_9PROT|nr:hypothetical protein [Acidisoma cellulosilyticum]MCB8883839.1 hypothetical protein [Acidisoma cellulosilyticum]
MARIKKEDHARILHLVDVERRAVREIATEFGCTAANIYSLLAKMRRGATAGEAGAGAAESVEDDDLPAMISTQPGLGLGLEPRADAPEPESLALEAAVPVSALVPAETMLERPAAAKLAIVPQTTERLLPEPTPSPDRKPVLGARLSKPGMGLVMRTEDGEETMTPFRSIDDLLSAIKPILRASARGTDAVWFSLQPVDLSLIEMDAA